MGKKNRKAKKLSLLEQPGAAGEMARYAKILPAEIHEPGGPLTFVIDGMNLAYRAYYAYARLQKVEMIFGVPSMIKTLIQNYKPHKVIVCWDGFKSPHRLELLPTYKEHRSKKKEEDPKKYQRFLKQIKKVRKLLCYMGIPQAHDPEIEGDDMVYMVAKREVVFNKVVIISGDKDFLQMVNWDISLINPRSTYEIRRTPYAFSIHEPYLEINQVVDYLCLTGDSTDDIPGIRGIGPGRAHKFLKTYPSIRAYLKEKKAAFPGLVDKDNLKKTYKRNRRLIDLELFNRKYLQGVEIKYYRDKRYPTFRQDRFDEFCTMYNLKTFRSENFQKYFKELQ